MNGAVPGIEEGGGSQHRKWIITPECFKKFKLIGCDGNPTRIRDKYGYTLCFLSNNVFLMAGKKAKIVYLGVCVAPKENTSENFISLSEAFDLNEVDPEILESSRLSTIHDIIAQRDEEFSEECPYINLFMMDAIHSQYMKVTFRLTDTLYKVLRNGEFVTREFISNQTEESLTPILEDHFVGPHQIELSAPFGRMTPHPNQRLSSIDRMKRARDFMGIDFITPFSNGEYFLATSDYESFSVFKFNGGESISQLENSFFNLGNKKLRGLTQVGESEMAFMLDDGSIKRILISNIGTANVELVELSNLRDQTLIGNHLIQSTERSQLFKVKLIQSLAELEFDFENVVRRNRLGSFMSNFSKVARTEGVRSYLDQNDLDQNQKPLNQVKRALENLQNLAQSKNQSLDIEEEKKRLNSFLRMENQVIEFMKLDHSRQDIDDVKTQLERDSDWDYSVSNFWTRSQEQDYDEGRSERSQPGSQKEFNELVRSFLYKLVEVYQDHFHLAKEEPSSIASFRYRHERIMSHQEASSKFGKRSSANVSVGIESEQNIRDGDSEDQEELWKINDVLICSTRGYSLREGRRIVFYQKDWSEADDGNFRKLRDEIDLKDLSQKVETKIDQMRDPEFSNKRRPSLHQTNSALNRRNPQEEDFFGDTNEEYSSKPFSDVEKIWITNLSQKSRKSYYNDGQKIQLPFMMHLLFNYQDERSGNTFKRLVSFPFFVRRFGFTGVTAADISLDSIDVVNKYHKRDFSSSKIGMLGVSETAPREKSVTVCGSIDELGVLNLIVR